MGYLDGDSLEASKTSDFKALNLPDEQILALSIENPAHFEVIVDRYQDAFTRAVKRVLGDREEVPDVVQEAFTKIYFNAHKYQPQEGAKFSSWAYKIVLNTTFTHYKKLKRKEEFGARIDDEIWALIPDAKESDFEKRTVRDEVARALARMPEPMAKMLTMHYVEDRPQAEIAQMEGISVSAVKTRIHRAKKEFRKIHLKLI